LPEPYQLKVALDEKENDMASKGTYAYKTSGKKDSRTIVLARLGELQESPQHKWIPIEEMSDGPQATLTARQADWLASQVEKKCEGAVIAFELLPQEAEAAA